MSDPRVPPRKPVPKREGYDEVWAKDLRSQFEHLLCNRRLNHLKDKSRNRSRTASPVASDKPSSSTIPLQPSADALSNSSSSSSDSNKHSSLPSYASLQSSSSIPSPPQDQSSIKFLNLLLSLSLTPTKYENPGLLDEALSFVPLDRIYGEAGEESQVLQTLADSMGDGRQPEWGYQDCVIKALLRWFKQSFFTWVDDPPCSTCYSPTVDQGWTPRTDDEAARGAVLVQLYKCSDPNCGTYERFPRYNDVWTLLQTRKGRCGEWVNCFSMLCRALGARVRWIWNSEDYNWAEIYSEHQKRWVHVDPCEEAWDRPTLYTEDWKKKLAYCIAFSNDGAMDVTRRYVRDPVRHGRNRTRAPEDVLLWIIQEVRRRRQENLSPEERLRLLQEGEREERELQSYVVSQPQSSGKLHLVSTNAGNVSGPLASAGDRKTPPERQHDAVEWGDAMEDVRRASQEGM